MLDIDTSQAGEIRLSGRFDASQAEKARDVFRRVQTSCTVDFEKLDYISSAGLGVLLEAQKRLGASGQGLRLVGMNPPIRNVFWIAGFNAVFEIE